MLEREILQHALDQVETANAVIAVAIGYADQAGARMKAAHRVQQFLSRGGGIAREALLGEIELVGPVHQFHGAIDMGRNVGLDPDGDARRAQEIVIVAAAHGQRVVAAPLHQLILGKPAQIGIVLADEALVGEDRRDQVGPGHLQIGQQGLRRRQIGRVVVDEQYRCRAQVHRIDHLLDAQSLGGPVDARVNEIIPQPEGAQQALDRFIIVAGADRIHDSAAA
jgi:hypothetical protein